MTEQKVPVAEAPKNTDTGKSTIICCLDVDITVANVDSIFCGYSQLAQSLANGIGGGFLADAFCFVLPNSHLYLGKEMGDKFLGGSHHLIADHSNKTAPTLQFVKHLRNAVIGTRCIE